ncbi:MAG: hypothetical protein Kow0062_10160 [Acidobacteriota bacterium]
MTDALPSAIRPAAALLVPLCALAVLASGCRGDAPRGTGPGEAGAPAASRAEPPAADAGRRSPEDAAFLAAYADAFDRILARLERLAPDFAPPSGEQGAMSLDRRVDAVLAEVERRCAATTPATAADTAETVARLDELRAELSVLRSRLADAERSLGRERAKSRDLERKLAAAEGAAREQRRRAEALADHARAFVIAATSGELRAMVRGNVLRRRLGLRSDYELTARALPIGATERTIVEVDPSARVIYLGPRVTEARIVSSHRGYDELYRIERRDGQLAVVLRDPVAFWRAGRYLIVQVEG